jgi:DNA-binding MarR family transcriptional regulator
MKSIPAKTPPSKAASPKRAASKAGPRQSPSPHKNAPTPPPPLSHQYTPAGFLLAQLGAHAARKFAQLLAPLHLTPPDAGILRVLRRSEGLSQQALADTLHIHPSALVAIIDDLENRALLKRRPSADDRRTYSLHLTDKGHAALRDIARASQEHSQSLLAALSPREREQLTQFLQRIASHEKLTPGVHPGYSRLGKPGRLASRR